MFVAIILFYTSAVCVLETFDTNTSNKLTNNSDAALKGTDDLYENAKNI